MRLNLGCGARHLPRAEGWLNVDRWGKPDYTWDLERVPWPWPSDSVEEVLLSHVLEHLGQVPAVFIGIMKELYRVCRNRARVRIVVPHHRHDNFANDPTHVRRVTPDGLRLFCQRLNRIWEAAGAANSRLGLEHGVNFEVVIVEERPDPAWAELRRNNFGMFQAMAATQNNLISEYDITMEVVK